MNNIHIGPNTVINTCKHIKINSDTAISYDCYITDSDSHVIFDKNTLQRTNYNREIVIGKHNWICSRSAILKGVHTADDVIIGCQSRVTKDLDTSNSIYVDNKKVRENIIFDFFKPTSDNIKEFVGE